MKYSLSNLRLLGFDESKHVPFTTNYRVHCSACAALAVNGQPTHETGCERTMHECSGCNEIIPARQRYCATCS